MAGTLKDLQVVHSMPGRTRLKFLPLKTHPHHHEQLRQKLAAIGGIQQVDTNPTTGSVVLYHDRTALHSLEFLAQVAAAFGLAALDPEDIETWLGLLQDETGPAVGGALDHSGSVVKRTMEDLFGRLDAKTVVPTLLLFLGVRSLLISDVLVVPKWYDYFWFAFGAHYALNHQNTPGDETPGIPSSDML